MVKQTAKYIAEMICAVRLSIFISSAKHTSTLAT